MTPPAIAHATGLSSKEVDSSLSILQDLGWAQHSRDVHNSVRAVHGGFALGALILDILDGIQAPDALAHLGGYARASCAMGLHRAAVPTTFLSSSLDSFSTLVEEALTQARKSVVTFHTVPVPGSETFLTCVVQYLRRRGVSYEVVMCKDQTNQPDWAHYLDTVRDCRVPLSLVAELPGRGVVIDRGHLAILHTETAGITVAPFGYARSPHPWPRSQRSGPAPPGSTARGTHHAL